MDGEGKKLDSDKLEFIEDKIINVMYEKIKDIYMYPTPEGNLILEWNNRFNPTVEINLTDLDSHLNIIKSDGSDFDEWFNLNLDDEWKKLTIRLKCWLNLNNDEEIV